MRQSSFSEPADYVIWSTSAMLALLVGLAASFIVWAGLHAVAEARLASVAVGTLGTGTVLIGLSLDRPVWRAFLVLFAAVFVLGYALGGPTFSHLLG